MSFIVKKAVTKYAKDNAKNYEPADPYYEIITDTKGKKKRVKRDVPPGLSKKDAKTLRKVRKRAHYLDKGVNLCGFRVGWTFFIGIIPGAGDAANAVLNYTLVVKPSRTLDLPSGLVSHMLFNNAVSAGVGLVPLVGDVALAVWKANWRNAHLLEEYLRKRGEDNLRTAAQEGVGFVGEAQAELANDRDVLAAEPIGYGTIPRPAGTPSGSRQVTPPQSRGPTPAAYNGVPAPPPATYDRRQLPPNVDPWSGAPPYEQVQTDRYGAQAPPRRY